MNKQMAKEMVNFVLVIAYTCAHYFYFAPLLSNLTDSRMLSIGVWSVVVGIWGNLVGMRLVKTIYVSKDYRRENYFFVIVGILLIVIGITTSI